MVYVTRKNSENGIKEIYLTYFGPTKLCSLNKMPILNPSLQCCLLKKYNGKSDTRGINFILYYLRIASKYLNQNISTIETSVIFQNDLKNSILLLQKTLGCNFDVNHDFNLTINDFYKYLFAHIISLDKKKNSKIQKGSFYICDDQFNTKLFQPSVFYADKHAWFFSDTPIAILCINNIEFDEVVKELIKLEIDLMAAAGFILVLCASCTSYTIDFYLSLIKDNQFSEIHLNILEESFATNFFEIIQKKVESHFDYYKGYFYLYSNFPDPQVNDIVHKFKKRSKFQLIFFCEPLEETFKNVDLYKSKPFPYCKTGFDSKYLRIHLSNIAIYDRTDKYSKVTGVSLCYISPNDFLTWRKKQVKILFNDQEENNHHTKNYVNFNDIHLIRPDLYVKRTISLMNVSKWKLKEVNTIKKKITKKEEKKHDFLKQHIFSLFKDKKISEGLRYVGYAYTRCFKDTISDFSIYETQLLTALDACQTFILNFDQKSKGMVYQVETGEGKSCIICLIAAVLALMNKSVHIASSNIKLANRDYIKSFKFFKMLGLKTAVLLHDNELPYSIKEKLNFVDKTSLINDSNVAFNLNDLDLESDKFFGNNIKSYFQDAIESEIIAYKDEYYPGELFKPKLFKNPSRMNFSVCGIDNNNKMSTQNEADIVFSTFVNFECLYLRMMETCQGIVSKYFSSCGLLIDEADSILIDEIANGTIVSREMKSNAKPILKFVYKQYKKNEDAEKTYELIKKYCKNYGSLELSDVKQMYEEIELVEDEEFSKKYSIETFQVKNSSKVKRFLKKTTKFIEKTSDKIENKIEMAKDALNNVKDKVLDKIIGSDPNIEKITNEEEEDSNNFENEEEEDIIDFEDEEEEIADTPTIEFKHIVPFDYEHKGILEPNKEFSGFIQQFIAIKEGSKKGNENMIIKDLAMNYLYVSHPIFAKLYGKVCGLTGTIGKNAEKHIFKKMYLLNTSKVPRHKPNQRVELPMILCQDFDERNKMIVKEVKTFHDKEFPVLVIFQDLKEINEVEFMLNSRSINNINIFDGKNDFVKPDKIAGLEGAVSLGTNVCGRGTDIVVQSKPLHVIITYYSTNSRVMKQAYGRTARQGQKGTYRVICVKDQYYNQIEEINSISIKNSISEFGFKNIQQEKFIDHFKKYRPWIFSGDIRKQSFTKKQIAFMRETRINVNRIIAYNYQFPIRMKVETFLDIQAQKIFSIFNCPNSEYTWILFQRYLREMILESWSLYLNEYDKINLNDENNRDNRIKFIMGMTELRNNIEKYIPIPNKRQKHNDADIIPTFMHIFKVVKDKYQDDVLKIFKTGYETYKTFNSKGFFSCQFGFRPFTLYTNSGARINLDNISEMNFIIDPELRYIQTLPGGRSSILSITQRIDVIFNMICKKINDLIGEKIGLKFFLRRTLGGCEFGICFDLIMKMDDSEKDYYCLVDKDPLLSFTIFIKNTAPILAGILIILLVFIVALTDKIFSWVFAFPIKFSKAVLLKCLQLFIKFAAVKVISAILESLLVYLEGIIIKQIKDIENFDSKIGLILSNLFNLFKNLNYKCLGKEFSSFFGCKIKIRSKFGKFIKNHSNYYLLLKLGIYLILCIGSFMLHFNNSKQSIVNANADAESFNKKCNKENANTLIKKNANKVKLNGIKKINDNELNHGFDDFLKQSESFLFRMELNDPTKLKVTAAQFIYDPRPNSKKNRVGNSYYSFHIYKSCKNPKKCFQIQYFGNTKEFRQEVILYSTFDNPCIVPFIGYYVERKNDFICLEMPSNGFLDEYINKTDKDIFWNDSAKFVIAYGIAYVMKYLHECHVIHRDLQPSNICLDSLMRPYLYNFYFARQTDQHEPFKPLQETSLRYMAPEFIKNPSIVQNSFKIDVYSYGMLLFNLLTEIEPFSGLSSRDDLINAIVSGERPVFTPSVNNEWQKLISDCWNDNPDERPTFEKILNDMDSKKFLNSNEKKNALSSYKKLILI